MDEKQPEHKQPSKSKKYLANERTFLTWIRNGIAISTGQTANVPHTELSLPIDPGMVAFGALMSFLAALRYREIRTAIEQDAAHPRPTLIVMTTAAVIPLAVVLIVYLLIASRQF